MQEDTLTPPGESPSPAALSFWHPVSLIATFFGAGKIPFAPGTMGSLAAFPFMWAVAWLVLTLYPTPPSQTPNLEAQVISMSIILCIIQAVLFALGTWAAHSYCKRTGTHDAGAIVIDEVVAQSLVLIAVYPSIFMIQSSLIVPVMLAGAFFLFRFFDIKKPWPINWCDEHIGGGFGIMFDDIVAAIGAIITYYMALFIAMDLFPGIAA